MSLTSAETVDVVFSTCRRTLGRETWGRVRMAMGSEVSIDTFPDALDSLATELETPGFISDLARLEKVLYRENMADADPAQPVAAIAVNPTLVLLALDWKNLPMMIDSDGTGDMPLNVPSHVMIWRHLFEKRYFKDS